MANDWQQLTAADVAASSRNALVGGPFGSNLVSSDYVPSGVPVIRGQNMGSRWVGGDFAFVTEAKAKSLEANLARPGDLIFTQRGTLGQVALVPLEPFDQYLISQSQMKLTVDERKANSLFLYYVFSSEAQQDYIRQHAIQTGVPHTNLGILRNTPIPIPPIEEQRAIAVVLGMLDNMIELNWQMNETLEGIARTIFRSWFVDFDPVHAKAEGYDTNLPKNLADLFPSTFQGSDAGNVPHGWRLTPLPDAIEVNPSRSLQRGEVAPYLEMANMPTRGHAPVSVITRPFGSGMRFSNGDTLVARITPCLENGKTAYVDFLESQQIGWGSTEYLVLRPKEPLPTEYAYFLARSDPFREFAIQSMTGSSGRQRVPAEALTHFRVVVPSEQIAAEFGKFVEPLMARMSVAAKQSRILGTLRDTLLPKLVSGELRLSDVERIIGRQV
jgi:type I restriction enzyme S subunit